MTNIIATDLQSQEVLSGLLELYVLEFGDNLSQKLYFHPGTKTDLTSVTFRDAEYPYASQTYIALPLQLRGVEVTGDGAPARPTLSVANVLTQFRTSLGDINADDIIGARITRRRTLEKYLTTGSYQGSAPTEFPSESYTVDRIVDESNTVLTYELANPFDLNTIQLPRRVVVGKYCSWVYRGNDTTFTSSDKLCGACNWNPKRGGSKRSYHTEDNEPIVARYTGNAYNASADYDRDDYVIYNTRYYRCLFDHTNQNPETQNSAYWTQVFVYDVWSSISTGATISVGDYVEHGNTVWKCVRQHDKASGLTPNLNSSYYTSGDICQKTLAACKLRFQSTHNGSGRTRTTLNERKALPFGAFPGSDSFR